MQIPTDQDAHGYDARALAKIDARAIAREEIASLCGLVLRRMQGDPQEALASKMAGAFAEALNDFSEKDSTPA